MISEKQKGRKRSEETSKGRLAKIRDENSG